MHLSTEQIIIFLQLPIVLFLIYANLQARKYLRFISFKIMSIAWVFNFLYLFVDLIFFQTNSIWANLFINLFDSLSSYLLICATQLKFKRELNISASKSSIVKLSILFCIVFLIINIFKLLGNDYSWNIDTLPSVLLDMICLVATGRYFYNFKERITNIDLLVYSFYGYSIIQLLALVKIHSFYIFGAYQLSISILGFSFGLIAKLSILISFLAVLLQMIKSIHKLESDLGLKNVLTIKLNQIIGRTFHEITPIIAQIDNQIENIYHSQNEIQLNKRARHELSKVEDSIYRLRTIIAASTKMYYNDLNEHKMDSRFSYPIQILEEEDIQNINTLLEVAITNFKTYLSILRNPEINIHDYDRNFLVTNEVSFRTEYASNCLVYGNSAELVQIFYNIFKNSYESISSFNDRCEIFIKTKNESKEHVAPGERSNKYIKIEIEDNGPGISSNIQNLVFNQGFSTKHDETGMGRGFGMYIIKSNTEKYNGTIEVESPLILPKVSKLGERDGTKIIIKFPKERK